MKISHSREKLAEGIHFTEIINERQKTNTITIHLVTELSAEKASLNAIIPYVLANSSSEYETVTKLSRKLASLYGANIRGVCAKIGDSQYISLTASCINDKYTLDGEAVTEETARVLTSCLTSPYVEDGGFFASDFALKKQELLDDIDAEINEKRSYAFQRSSAVIYKDEPCAVTVKGERKYAEALTPVLAYEHYKELMKTAQIEVCFVGANGAGDAKKIISDALLALDRSYVGDNSSALSPAKSEPARVTESLDVVQSKMVMAFKTPYEKPHVMRMFSAIYGGTPFSRLFMNVREKLSLCYYCSSAFIERKGVLFVDSGIEHSNVQKTEAEILNQLEAMKNGEFSDEDMNNSRLSLINSLRGVNDSARSLTDWYFRQSYMGTSLSPEDDIERIKAVTREEIIEAAKTLTLDTVYVLTGKESDED